MEDHHQASDKARLGLALGLGKTVRWFFVSVPDFRATGVRDGKRAYERPAIIRAVNAVDAMTAEVPGICRVVRDPAPKLIALLRGNKKACLRHQLSRFLKNWCLNCKITPPNVETSDKIICSGYLAVEAASRRDDYRREATIDSMAF